MSNFCSEGRSLNPASYKRPSSKLEPRPGSTAPIFQRVKPKLESRSSEVYDPQRSAPIPDYELPLEPYKYNSVAASSDVPVYPPIDSYDGPAPYAKDLPSYQPSTSYTSPDLPSYQPLQPSGYESYPNVAIIEQNYELYPEGSYTFK